MITDSSQLRTYPADACVAFRGTKERFGGLSNMAGGFPLRVNSIVILSAEALYQACRFPHLPEIQQKIIDQKSPMTAKMVSKPFRHETRRDWDAIRVRVMRWVLRVKLAQNWSTFSELLLATDDLDIVEDSHRDDFWGAIRDDGTLVGMNVLGRLLMDLRQQLRGPDRESLRVVVPPAIPNFTLLCQPVGPVGVTDPTGIAVDPDTVPTPSTLWTFAAPVLLPARPNAERSSAPVQSPKPVPHEGELMQYPKRLIEVDLPIARISAHARREKSIRHGHISTLHIWWARRPLAACRAVICAALWPDPEDLARFAGDGVASADGPALRPERFLSEARAQMSRIAKHFDSTKTGGEELIADIERDLFGADKAKRVAAEAERDRRFAEWKEFAREPDWSPQVLRKALLAFIAWGAGWEQSTMPTFLETARALTQAAHEALGGEPGTRPLVVDPFAGGGSIPLEALRVGADAFASDLNPIPVLLNKVVLEYIPKYGNAEVTMPDADGKPRTFHGLADAVRYWGGWIKEQAERELAAFYPSDPPDKKNGIPAATPIAYLWARTILSEAPGQGDIPVEVPLMRSLWLAKKAGRRRALRWVRDEKTGKVKTQMVEVTYQQRDDNGGRGSQPASGGTGLRPVMMKVKRPLLEIFEPKKDSEVEAGTVARGSATCPVTGYTTPVASVRAQLKQRRGGAADARLFCIVTTRAEEQGRFYRLPTKADEAAFDAAAAELERRERADGTEHSAAGRAAGYRSAAAGAGGADGSRTLVPDEPLDIRGIRRMPVRIYGMERWGDLFSPRQALALTTLARLVREAGARMAGRSAESAGHADQTVAAQGRSAAALPSFVAPQPIFVAPQGRGAAPAGRSGAPHGPSEAPHGRGEAAHGRQTALEGCQGGLGAQSGTLGLGPGMAAAVTTILAMQVCKQADLGNTICRWEPVAQCPRQLFARQAVVMCWDFAEGVPIGDSSGGFDVQIDRSSQLLAEISDASWVPGHIEQASATVHPLPDDAAAALVTDPPYYDAILYAYLSDFFYVWMRRTLADVHPALFRDDGVPKDIEIVVDPPHQLSPSHKDIAFYERELMRAFSEARRFVRPDGVGCIVFASKSTASWEAILKAVIDAGWVITGSWPIDTEMETRVAAQGQARLGSSVHIVCRPREDAGGAVRTDDVGDWRDVLAELPRRMHAWMPRLAAEGVVGADAIFACLGPALEIFSRYSRVEKASGEVVTLGEYLEQVWAAVSKEALSLLFKDADAAGLEPDARLTAMWLWTLGGGKPQSNGKGEQADGEGEDTDDDEGEDGGGKKPAAGGGFVLEFDAARKIAQGLGAHLEKLPTVVEVKGDKARLLSVAERTKHLFGKEAEAGSAKARPKRSKTKQGSLFEEMEQAEAAEGGKWGVGGPSIGSTSLDRVHQAMILFAAGRGEALRRFLVEDGAGKDARFWKLADNLVKLYPAGTDERRWLEGVLGRKKGLGL